MPFCSLWVVKELLEIEIRPFAESDERDLPRMHKCGGGAFHTTEGWGIGCFFCRMEFEWRAKLLQNCATCAAHKNIHTGGEALAVNAVRRDGMKKNAPPENVVCSLYILYWQCQFHFDFHYLCEWKRADVITLQAKSEITHLGVIFYWKWRILNWNRLLQWNISLTLCTRPYSFWMVGRLS